MKEWFWIMAKTIVAVTVLVGVWGASAWYQARSNSEEFESFMQVRVRSECLRPDYIRSALAAREYDLTLKELDLVEEKVTFTQRRADGLLEHAQRIEAMRSEYTQGKIIGGVGGPAPTKKTSP